MRIEHSLRASKTPAFALLAEGWNELVQEGLTPESSGLSPVEAGHEVLFAVSAENDIVGVIAYAFKASLCTVALAYVEPSSRKRGIFKAMLERLKTEAKEYGADRIELEAPTENAPFQAVMRHMNSPALAVRYELAL